MQLNLTACCKEIWGNTLTRSCMHWFAAYSSSVDQIKAVFIYPHLSSGCHLHFIALESSMPDRLPIVGSFNGCTRGCLTSGEVDNSSIPINRVSRPLPHVPRITRDGQWPVTGDCHSTSMASVFLSWLIWSWMMHLDMQTMPGCMFHQQGDVRQNGEQSKKAGDITHACMNWPQEGLVYPANARRPCRDGKQRLWNVEYRGELGWVVRPLSVTFSAS